MQKKEIKKLTDKCGVARCIYDCKLNASDYYDYYVRWIPFGEFKNIGYLAKGGFGEVYKATWINGYYGFRDRKVVLKRIYNSNDKIVDILKEVKVYYILLLLLNKI